MNDIVVAGYDPKWRDAGAALAAGIRDGLAPLAKQVEHIGSTSIPGMAAKPILDLQASVTDLSETDDAFGPWLTRHGFARTPYQRDHVPAGIDDDPGRWTKRLWARRDHADPDANLHVRLLGSPNERLALLFRDWFRSHPEAVPAYARFKRALAREVPDVGVYSDVKDPVVDLVIAIAEPWAAATGWQPRVTSGRPSGPSRSRA
jgi:GrpB-like predicted nucleotidyltransferase (UPF0157 family)